MERFRIGRCRSGRNVTSYPDLDELASDEEVFDAAAVLTVVALRELRRDPVGELGWYLQNAAERLIDSLVLRGQWEQQMALVGAKTGFDVARYGRSLLLPEFRESR